MCPLPHSFLSPEIKGEHVSRNCRTHLAVQGPRHTVQGTHVTTGTELQNTSQGPRQNAHRTHVSTGAELQNASSCSKNTCHRRDRTTCNNTCAWERRYNVLKRDQSSSKDRPTSCGLDNSTLHEAELSLGSRKLGHHVSTLALLPSCSPRHLASFIARAGRHLSGDPTRMVFHSHPSRPTRGGGGAAAAEHCTPCHKEFMGMEGTTVQTHTFMCGMPTACTRATLPCLPLATHIPMNSSVGASRNTRHVYHYMRLHRSNLMDSSRDTREASQPGVS